MTGLTRDQAGSEQYGEEALHDLWATLLSDHPSLQTRDGEALNIVSPGRPAAGSGPDFTGCIIEVDGEIWTGDAELHVHETDWRRHGHSGDEAFHDLLLHVCLHPSRSGDAPDQIRRTVILNRQLTEGHLRHLESDGRAEVTRFPCPAGAEVQEHPERVRDVMERLEGYGRRRFQRRAREIRGWMSEAGHRRNVFAATLLECMGLHRNRTAARSLAERVSFGDLKRFLHPRREARVVQRKGEAWLLRKAGLLADVAGKQLFVEEGAWPVYRERALTMADGVDPVQKPGAWEQSGTSPMNSPFRRIAGFLALFRRLFLQRSVYQTEERLVRRVIETSHADRSDAAEAKRVLLGLLTIDAGEGASYWTEHCAPGKRLSSPAGLVGRHRAAVLWINGVAPYLAALAKEHDLPELEQALVQFAESYPLPVGDHRTRRAGRFLFGPYRDDVPLTLFIEQGMHALYSGNCRFGPTGCSRCELRSDMSAET